MIRVILCEGITDALLLSFYLEKTSEWKYNKNPKNFIKLPDSKLVSNKSVFNYVKKEEELLICAVGGKDNFGSFYKEYINEIIYHHSPTKEYRIALMIDADNRNSAIIEEDIQNQFNNYIDSVKIDEWVENERLDSFQEKVKINFLLTIIPHDKSGALETVLLNSLKELNEGEYIVNESEKFVESLKENEYIHKTRMKLKAKLGVALSIFYPDKVFSQFDSKLQIVDWTRFENLRECFKELIKI